MIVVDASLVVTALISETPRGEAAGLALTSDPHWIAPDHLRVEATSAIRGRWLAGKLTDTRADAALDALNRLTISYAAWDVVADRVWELRHSLNPYDAAYIALAESRGCKVVTADRKLRDCSIARCPVEVVAAN